MTAPANTPCPQLDAADDLVCPQCGYELRGLTSDQCPECGTHFDRESLRTSRIPWTHRRQIGWLRAYFRTVWLGTAHPARLVEELARPVSDTDARGFRLITAAVAGIALAAVIIAEFIRAGGTGFIDASLNPLDPLIFRGSAPGLEFDAVIPWLAGATVAAVLPACALLFMLLVTGAHRWYFRVRSPSSLRAYRSFALSAFALAPLAWLPIAVAVFLGVSFLRDEEVSSSQPIRMFSIIALLSIACIVLLAWLNLLRLLLRATQNDWLWTLLAAAAIPLSWVGCALVAFGVVPWIFGFLWIVIDSLT